MTTEPTLAEALARVCNRRPSDWDADMEAALKRAASSSACTPLGPWDAFACIDFLVADWGPCDLDDIVALAAAAVVALARARHDGAAVAILDLNLGLEGLT